jgi:hypothetical protein
VILRIVVPVVLAFAALQGCGLEVVPFLAAPLVETVATGGVTPEFSFDHNPDSNPEVFRGFELYYKFYDPDGYVENYETDIRIIESQFTSSPATVLGQRGFRRVNDLVGDSPGSVELPLMPVSAGLRSTRFTVDITFPGTVVSPAPGVAVYPAATGNNEVQLARSANETTQVFQTFSPDAVETSDADVANTITDTAGIAVGLAVLAFGRESVSFPAQAVYSAPVGLGVAPLLP